VLKILSSSQPANPFGGNIRLRLPVLFERFRGPLLGGRLRTIRSFSSYNFLTSAIKQRS